jgi:spore germination protein YaaH
MPFGYIVQNDGSLHDAFGMNPGSSTTTDAFVAAARAKKVRVVPTIMWSNGAAIETILSNGASRRELEDTIANLAIANGFDGVDIDFENKTAETKPYFSLFLKGLYARLGNKFLYCSIEARTPPTSAFDVPPAVPQYANDFVAINKYCDRVAIMAYDQGAIDLRLNAAASSTPYIPIADPAWVKKVIQLAAKDIAKSKILIGVPTYGYEYDLVPITQGYRYNIDWAFNPRYATDLASQMGLVATRNKAGEMSFVYQPTTTPATATTTTLRIAWWSDAKAIQDKLKLAKSLGVRGIAIFKLDGGEDPALWDVLPKKR